MSKDKATAKYSININFEAIKLPPFQDILVVAKNSHHGKIGLFKSFELLIPNNFEIVEVTDDEKVDVVFINKRILAKMSSEKVISILKTKVFKYISDGELLKVDFKVSISYTNIEDEL